MAARAGGCGFAGTGSVTRSAGGSSDGASKAALSSTPFGAYNSCSDQIRSRRSRRSSTDVVSVDEPPAIET